MRAFPKTAARDDPHVTVSVFCPVALFGIYKGLPHIIELRIGAVALEKASS